MAKVVKVIPATKNKFTAMPTLSVSKRRVAAYARVSTDSDEQFTSYEAQIDYYTNYIKMRSDWIFVNVYTDEGITGTSTKNRAGFNQMVKDALSGKIDLIITKSVSRFARNTVDSLTTVRKLKEAGVEVFFEKENIYTFDSKGELLITIMSSLAQEESRSISENVTWGQRKRFADGKISMPYKNFLGYDKGEDGQPVINEKEAETVRLIYKLFLKGMTGTGISKELESRGIPSPTGKKNWHASTVNSILTNEKYKGDALLQKKFTVDFLTKKTKVNRGEVPQYYIEGSHPAIIDPVEFSMVQAEFIRRKKLGRSYRGMTVFSTKIICGECGSFYGQKIWHSNDKYRSVSWRCNRKENGVYVCDTPVFDIQFIKDKFIIACNKLLSNREKLLLQCENKRKELSDCSEIENEIADLNQEITKLTEKVEQCVNENASKKQSQEQYVKKYNSLVKRHSKAVEKFSKAKEELELRKYDERLLYIFYQKVQTAPETINEWNEELWISILENATVNKDESVVFLFKDGTSIKIE